MLEDKVRQVFSDMVVLKDPKNRIFLKPEYALIYEGLASHEIFR